MQLTFQIPGSYGVAVNFVAEGKESTSLNEIEANCGVTITPLPGIVHMHKLWNKNENTTRPQQQQQEQQQQ